MPVKIENDRQLREALNDLPRESQRHLGARFVDSVSHLCSKPIIAQGITVAINSEHTADDLDYAYRNAKKLAIERYTSCGQDADWAIQAEHFVAAALAACLLPEEQFSSKDNPAWKAAMQARMARNCEMIINDSGEVDGESNRQYAIAEAYLA